MIYDGSSCLWSLLDVLCLYIWDALGLERIIDLPLLVVTRLNRDWCFGWGFYCFCSNDHGRFLNEMKCD